MSNEIINYNFQSIDSSKYSKYKPIIKIIKNRKVVKITVIFM